MSRLKYIVGSRVSIEGVGCPFFVVQVQAALELPYLLSNDVWYDETLLSTYVEPSPTWEDVEAYIKGMFQEVREIFQEREVNGLRVVIKAEGRSDGDIKISYSVAESDYDSNKASSYSLRPSLDEFFRGKTWKARNEPLSLSYGGNDDQQG